MNPNPKPNSTGEQPQRQPNGSVGLRGCWELLIKVLILLILIAILIAYWMGVFGPLARSVEDLETALRIVAGPDGYDAEAAPALRSAPQAPPAVIAPPSPAMGMPPRPEPQRVQGWLASRLEKKA